MFYVCSLAFSQLMQDKHGETALMTASADGHLETAKLLLQRGASINFQRKVRELYRIAGKVWWGIKI